MTAIALRLNIEKKLYLTYSLNVIDWLCTIVLLSTGSFYEANPISRMFIGNIPMGFALKVAVPLVAVVFISWGMRWLDEKSLRTTDCFIAFALTVYLAILLDHAVNFVILAIG